MVNTIISPLRFAVLRHTDCPRTHNHHDIMLEGFPGVDPDEVALIKFETTTQLDQARIDVTFRGMSRRHYLHYEGSISQNRGNVKRVDEGRYTLKGTTCITFDGKRIKGDYLLETKNQDTALTDIQKTTALRKKL